MKGKEHKRPDTENSVKRHERAKKKKQSIVTQQPESLTSVAETESAAATLLALSHSSPFKENSGKVFQLQKIYKSTFIPNSALDGMSGMIKWKYQRLNIGSILGDT